MSVPNQMNGAWLVLAALLSVGVVWTLASGCATNGGVDEDADPVTEPTDAPKKDAGANARPVDATVKDTSVPDPSRPDANNDASGNTADSGLVSLAGEDFDPVAPRPGDPCPPGVPVNDLVSRRCGKCGVQRAFCETGLKVGQYSSCVGEKTAVDSCLPRAREVGVECGLCGSKVRVCDNACVWTTGLCVNEVAGGCLANEVSYAEGVCANPAEVRKQTCSTSCVRGTPEPCGPQLPDTLTASQTRAGAVSGTFSLTTTRTIPRLNTGVCPVTSSTVNVTYHYARIVNSGADSINVTVTQTAPAVGTKPDTSIAAYVGRSVAPIDAVERQACTGQVRDNPESLTFTIPAGDSALVLSTAFFVNTTGKLKLEVVTNFIGAEPAPTVDADVVMDAVMGQTVTAPVTFVATQVLERVSTGACPKTLSTTKPAFRYIRLSNPTAIDRTANIWLASPSDTVIGVYPGPTPPTSTNRGACIGEIADGCAAATGISGANSCLGGVNVPAMGSVIVYASLYSLTTGSTTFNATTTN